MSYSIIVQLVQPWELTLVADVVASLKQQRSTETIHPKTQQKLILTDVKLAECLVVSSHVPTQKHKAKHGHITQKRLFQLLLETNKQTAVSGFYICV